MTKPRPPPGTKTRRRSQKHRSSDAAPLTSQSLDTYHTPVSQIPVQREARRLTPVVVGEPIDDSVQRPVQYLGSTSYAYVLPESHHRRNVHHDEIVRPISEAPSIFRSPFESAIVDRLRSFH